MVQILGLVFLALGALTLFYRTLSWVEARRTLGEAEMEAEALEGGSALPTGVLPFLASLFVVLGIVLVVVGS